MNFNRAFRQRVKDLVNDPVFDKPIANLNKDYSQKGEIKLITKIKLNNGSNNKPSI
jgi:hypothetical protein